MKNRSLLHVLFALLLLLTQQGVLAHSASHAFEDYSQRSEQNKLPVEALCGQCLAHAQWGGAIGNAAMVVALSDSDGTHVLLSVHKHFVPRPSRPFESRAPPEAEPT